MTKHHHSNKTIPADIVRRHPFANPLVEAGGCATMHKNKVSKWKMNGNAVAFKLM